MSQKLEEVIRIKLFDLFMFLLIFNLIFCVLYLSYLFQKVFSHNFQGSKLKIQLKKEEL